MNIGKTAHDNIKTNLLTQNESSSLVCDGTSDETARPNKFPIKVVDVNKLLKSPNSGEKKITSKPKMNTTNEHQSVKKFAALARPKDSTSATISHVLSCFKEMLPSKFDLSKLIPNEKLTTLVVRYLKLNNDESSFALVKGYLQIIINASKAKESKFGDYSKHPYLKIEDTALQAALVQVLPKDFSMVDVTNQVLHCLCVILKIGVYSDGFHFLRTQIRKFTAEGQQFNQIMNRSSEESNSTMSPSNSLNETVSEANKTTMKKEIQCPPSKGPKLKNWPPVSGKTLKIKNWPPLNQDKHKQIITNGSTPLVPHTVQHTVPQTHRPKQLQFTTKIISKKSTVRKSKDIFPLEGILTYLKIKKCTAKDVLANFSLMFYLCRHLRVKSRQSNLTRIKAILSLIDTKNIDMSNFKQHKKELDYLKCTPVREFSHKTCAVKGDIKLNLSPVVILENITDFAKEQMLFMRKKSKSVKSEDPFLCNQLSHLAQSYSSEHVRKLTHDSYREFRKIVMKKNGVKVSFHLKFSALAVGTGVFVKDFRNPALGWEKGEVKQMKGPFRFLIKLDRGVKKWCFPDQIRPFPKGISTDARPQRPVKPKKLLDL